MAKRQLKSINVKNLSTPTTVEDVENTPNLKDLVYDELCFAIQEAIENEKDIATLFELNHSGCILELKEKLWIDSLNSALKYFEKKEKYEKCTVCNNLIEKANEYSRKHKQDDQGSGQYTKRKNVSKKKKENKLDSEQGDIHPND